MRWTPPILVAAPRSGQALRMPLSRSAAETRWGRFPYAGGGPAHRSVGQPSNFGEDADRIGEDVAAGADPRELAVHFREGNAEVADRIGEPAAATSDADRIVGEHPIGREQVGPALQVVALT
jgi:hypothetical protein